jgi:hypothetical protein
MMKIEATAWMLRVLELCKDANAEVAKFEAFWYDPSFAGKYDGLKNVRKRPQMMAASVRRLKRPIILRKSSPLRLHLHVRLVVLKKEMMMMMMIVMTMMKITLMTMKRTHTDIQ